MGVSKEPDYRYYKTYLYPLHKTPGAGDSPWGTAEIVINGAKGMLSCQAGERLCGLMAADPSIKFSGIVMNESTGENLWSGELVFGQIGQGQDSWEFTAGYAGRDKPVDSPLIYRLQVMIRQSGEGSLKTGGHFVQGVFSLPFEIRDSRIVGFKKEGTAKKPGREAFEKNPIIQKVEPFEPPIPNSVWWQISLQPDFRHFRQAEFCPRQKSYKAVF